MKYRMRVTRDALEAWINSDSQYMTYMPITKAYFDWTNATGELRFGSERKWIRTLKRDGGFYIIPVDIADFGIEAVED